MEKEISEEISNYQNYSQRRRRDLKKKHANEIKQHPKNLKQQQANIRKLYKHQYNTQNKQYKTYKEQIINQTPKEQVREKLEQIKDEQNRKFSLLYEHYKTNVDAVYQQQNLKLNATQQLEQDQLNDDLERQMNVLYQSHLHRKKQQSDTFNKEIEQLEFERLQKHKDLKAKMDNENEEFEKTGKQRLNKLTDMQQIIIEKFDKDCYESYGIQMSQLNNRYSVFNLMGSPNSTMNGSNFNNLKPNLSFFSSIHNKDDFNSPNKLNQFNSKLKSSTSVCSSNNNLSNNDKMPYYMTEGLSLSSTTSSVISSSSASNPSHSAAYCYQPPNDNNKSGDQLQYQFQANQQSILHNGNEQYSIDPYLAHLNNSKQNPTSYTSSSSSAPNSNRRNSTAFS